MTACSQVLVSRWRMRKKESNSTSPSDCDGLFAECSVKSAAGKLGSSTMNRRVLAVADTGIRDKDEVVAESRGVADVLPTRRGKVTEAACTGVLRLARLPTESEDLPGETVREPPRRAETRSCVTEERVTRAGAPIGAGSCSPEPTEPDERLAGVSEEGRDWNSTARYLPVAMCLKRKALSNVMTPPRIVFSNSTSHRELEFEEMAGWC